MKSFPFSLKSLRWPLVIASFLTAVASSFAQTTTFDPANDDTDLFLANPSIASERPNVLIVLDNTANWNTAFTNEKSALVSVVNGLSDAYNVGLMMFPETGGGNDSIDGGYVKFGVRQMTSANKSALASIVGGLDKLADKGNNATPGLALYEAYLYFGGRTAVAGYGKVKRDFAGNTTNNPLAAMVPGNAFADAATHVYNPAIGNNCQKNFIIYISNGPAPENASARAQLQGYLTTLKGGTAPTQLAINPSGLQGNWSDEMAQFMANNDVSSVASGNQNVITYTVEVDPGSSGQGPDMTALLKSMASNGKGKYFAVSSGSSGSAIVSALNQIFTEIQAVNSVFAAASLPVSANVRGTNLNQVYVGVFRPDASRLPRWFGNLKMYQFAINSATNAVFLADANLVPAENQATGFIANTATSLWTSPSTFWAFRTPFSATDVGQASDAADGDLVEKGGAAERLRIKYAGAEAASPRRNMYTCTTGTVNCDPACVNGVCPLFGAPGYGSLLSNTPFSTANTDLTAAAFNLNTQLVNPLTASATQQLTSLSDTLPIVSLSNITGAGVAVTLNNGTVSKTVTSITSSATRTLTSLVANTVTATIAASAGCVYVGGAIKRAVVTTTSNHNLLQGQSVTITGNTLCNGTYTVNVATSFTPTTFSFNANLGSSSTVNGGTVTGSGTTLTGTFTNHGFGASQPLTISSAADTTYNGNYTIASVTANTFTFTRSTPPATASTTAATAFSQILTATVNASAHGFSAGQSIVISGAPSAAYNNTFVIAASPAPTANSFTIPLTTRASDTAAAGMSASGGGSTTVVATTVGAVAHGFAGGSSVGISGASPSAYNISYPITFISATQFSFTTSSILAGASGSITASGGAASTTATLNTAYAHGLAVGNTFQISGITGDINWNNAGVATWTVATVPTPTSLTFSTAAVGTLGAPTGSGVVLGPPGGRRVWAKLTGGHGYSTTGVGGAPQIKISGATPAGYNGTFNITVIPQTFPLPTPSTSGSEVFTYLIAAGAGPQLGANTALIVNASRPTTLATATSANHGFITGDTVAITGATPTAFNSATVSSSGSVAVNVIDSNTFTYNLATAQFDATGSVQASKAGGTGGGVANLINWVRGQDNAEDENVSSSGADVRASIHGDVLHSRPLVINYNRGGSFPSGDNDVVIFYGTNGGAIQAIQGGLPPSAGADPHGNELWSFVPSEFFPNLNRLRNNSPKVSSSFKRPYFADGSFTAYIKNVGNLTKLGESGDIVYIYATFRRGGRMLYALDVSDPATPRFRWKIDQSTTGFAELGQTWSKPVLIPQINGFTNPVLLFGGGWDPAVEDIDPLTVASVSSTGNVTKTDGTVVSRSMGRAIYMVDAITGQLLWRAESGAAGSSPVCTGPTLVAPAICKHADLNYAFPADSTVVRNIAGGLPNHAYIGDTGGQMWRIDFGSANQAQWSMTKLASIANQATPAGRRKFLYSPDVVGQTGYDAVLVGTGDREHPFDVTVANRMYMFKDAGTDSGPQTGVPGNTSPTIVESALFDVTPATSSAAVNSAALASAQGWYVTLGAGEKLTGSTFAVAGSTYFGTNQPDAAAGGGSCGNNLGVARLYQISITDGSATGVPTGASTTASRSITVPGGGFLPPPSFGMPDIPNTNPDGTPCTTCGSTPRSILCFGVKCIEPGAVTIGARIRRYWYKEISE